MGFRICIPARYASARLPGKALLPLNGKPLIAHVVDRARRCGADEVIVATDSDAIATACRALDVDVAMTDAGHASGTDSIAQVAADRGWADDAVVVNVQGDEPLVPAAIVQQVARLLLEGHAPMATVCTPITSADELRDPNAVKVVLARDGAALYFSRATVPCVRDGADDQALGVAMRHVGIYGYRVAALRELAQKPPGALESLEKLEQLRALWLGYRIEVAVAAEAPAPGVDTADDLRRVEALLRDGEQ
ncbi:MAG: 3-deoxy-manno-octulosonate cytidylyltransferase [Pseudomonadota bacterium]